MNFYKKMRNKTTLSPSEVVEKMKEVAPSLNANLDVKKYLQCEKGYRKMKGERLDSFLQVINNAKNNPVEQTLDRLNLEQWFEDFRTNHYEEKMKEFGIESQNKLAKKLGIAQSSLSDTIRGKVKPSQKVMLKLRQFFEDDMNVDVEEMMPKSTRGGYHQRTNVPEEEWQKLFDQVRECLEINDMNCVELSKYINIDDSTIGKIKRGRISSRGKVLYEKLSTFFENGVPNLRDGKIKPIKPEINYSKYVDIIQAYRKENNLSLRELGNQIGISEATTSQVLNFKYASMTQSMVDRLKEFCDSINSIEEPTEENVKEPTMDNVKEVVEEISNENTVEENIETPSEEKEEEHTGETKEKPFVYEFNLTGTKEFDDICNKYNKLLKKYNREHEILKNYEVLINVIKSLQK